MGQELQIPASFKTHKMADAFAGLNPAEDSLAEGIGQSYAVIGYKGKVWSLRYRGERHNIIRPDDGTPSAFLDLIILGQARQKSKSFYKKYDAATSDGDRPICASIDGLVPDDDVQAKQSETCALCPRNTWKNDPQTGRKGRECSDYKRLAVMVLPTQTKAILGEPLMEPVFLRVPAASLNSLAIMGETMGRQGHHYSSYITRVKFDPNESHPKMIFQPIQSLGEDEAPVILELRQDPMVGRITGEAPGRLALAAPPPLVTLAPPGTVSTGFSGGDTTATTMTLPSSASPGAQRATPKPREPGIASPTIVMTPSGGNGSVMPVPSPEIPDTGSSETNDEMDAHIASLMKKAGLGG